MPSSAAHSDEQKIIIQGGGTALRGHGNSSHFSTHALFIKHK